MKQLGLNSGERERERERERVAAEMERFNRRTNRHFVMKE